jgi:hypothetical protein
MKDVIEAVKVEAPDGVNKNIQVAQWLKTRFFLEWSRPFNI